MHVKWGREGRTWKWLSMGITIDICIYVRTFHPFNGAVEEENIITELNSIEFNLN